MRIVIAGGAGFIGQHLTRRLLEEQHSVLVLDNFVTAKMPPNALLNHERYTLLYHDISRKIILDEIDAIFNLACPASPVDYMRIPVQTMHACYLGTMHLLELAVSHHIPYVHISTSEVYGDPQVHPQPESYWGHVNPIGIRACYDEGKRAAEALCISYREQYNANIRIARLFNTYGPGMRQDDGRMIPAFIDAALQDKPIIIYGDGSQTRSPTYIDDTIEGIMRLWQSDYTDPVNIGNNREYTVKEIAEIVIRLTESESLIRYELIRSDDPLRRCPDITQAIQRLSWIPTIPIEVGLQHMIESMQMEFMQYYAAP